MTDKMPMFPLFEAVSGLHEHLTEPEELLDWAAYKEVCTAYESLRSRVEARALDIAVQWARENGGGIAHDDFESLSFDGDSLQVVTIDYEHHHSYTIFPVALMDLSDDALAERARLFEVEKARAIAERASVMAAERAKSLAEQEARERAELARLTEKYKVCSAQGK